MPSFRAPCVPQVVFGVEGIISELANKIGMAIPEAEGGTEDRAAAAERESLIKLHETAAEFFKAQLASPAGARPGCRAASARPPPSRAR